MQMAWMAGSILGVDFCIRKTLSSVNGVLFVCQQLSQLRATGQPRPGLVSELLVLNLDFKLQLMQQLLLDFKTASEQQQQQQQQQQQTQTHIQPHIQTQIIKSSDDSGQKLFSVCDTRQIGSLGSSSSSFGGTPDQTIRFVLSIGQTKLDHLHAELIRLRKLQHSEHTLSRWLWPIDWNVELKLLRTLTAQLNELLTIIIRLGAMRVFPIALAASASVDNVK